MIKSVLALVIDFRTTAEAERLTLQVADSPDPGVALTVAHVDNGNAVPVTLSPAQRERGVRLVRATRNGGYAAGVRGAIEQFRRQGETYDAFWLLNSDLEIEPECLSRLVDVLRAHAGTAAVGPTVLEGRGGRVWGARGVVSPLWGTTAMTPWPRGGVLPKWSYLPGCSLLVRSDAYDRAGGIPDRYGMYYEETHLCVQLQQQGWELRVEPSAVVYHEADAAHGGLPAPHRAFYFARNNLYFWRANFGIPPYIQLPRTLVVVIKDLVLPLWRAPSPAAAALRLRFIALGLIDGFAFLRRRSTRFERKHFGLTSDETASPGR